MILVTLARLAEVTKGKYQGKATTITSVTTDTRQVTPGSLFVALKGERFDAHDFVDQAVTAGCAAVLVSRRVTVNVPQIIVQDTRLALGQLGAWMRQQVNTRVIGLTGSSGKTSVKEMTAAILRCCGETLYTQGNLNNDLGVPITLLRLTPEDHYAVIEMGANHQGEIAYTSNLVKPEAALINNLAAAHLEGFGSLAGVAKAKGEIFDGLKPGGTAIINAESHDFNNWQPSLNDKRVWRFSSSYQNDVDFWASDCVISTMGTGFQLHTPVGTVPVQLPLPGYHNIANALAAAALSLAVDAPLSAIQQGLSQLQAVPGRLYPIRLTAQQLLLDDSYNANVGSMTAAVQVLAQMPGYRVLVVGDMGELGDEAEDCHRQIGEQVTQAGIDQVLSIGQFSQHISAGNIVGEHFVTKTKLVERLKALLSQHQEMTILIKGSRSAAMEQVVELLKEKDAC